MSETTLRDQFAILEGVLEDLLVEGVEGFKANDEARIDLALGKAKAAIEAMLSGKVSK